MLAQHWYEHSFTRSFITCNRVEDCRSQLHTFNRQQETGSKSHLASYLFSHNLVTRVISFPGCIGRVNHKPLLHSAHASRNNQCSEKARSAHHYVKIRGKVFQAEFTWASKAN